MAKLSVVELFKANISFRPIPTVMTSQNWARLTRQVVGGARLVRRIGGSGRALVSFSGLSLIHAFDSRYSVLISSPTSRPASL